jgi:hypothetical protein
MSQSPKWQAQVAKFKEKNARRLAEKKSMSSREWAQLRAFRKFHKGAFGRNNRQPETQTNEQ